MMKNGMEWYYQTIIDTMLVIITISLILSGMVLFRRIKRKEKRQRIIKLRLERVAVLWKRNAVFGAFYIVVSMAISSMTYSVSNTAEEAVKVYGDEHGLAANIESISNIEPDRWDTLNIEEKLVVAQKIINCEARYYGLSYEIIVGTAKLSDGMLAYYRNSSHQIVIDVDYLESSYGYTMLRTLLHEAHHAYAHAQVELYQELAEKDKRLLMFYNASIYEEEFSDYVHGADNYYDYYTQAVEIHARKAGETESLEYIKAINEYLGIELEADMNEFTSLKEYISYILQE